MRRTYILPKNDDDPIPYTSPTVESVDDHYLSSEIPPKADVNDHFLFSISLDLLCIVIYFFHFSQLGVNEYIIWRINFIYTFPISESIAYN